MPATGVTLGFWQDRDALEAMETARLADTLGFRDLWLGEMATFDAFALATAVGLATRSVALTVGPLAAAVRSPVAMAMGVASVAALTGRPVHLAIGASSPVVVERWHGRSWAGATGRLRETAVAVRPLLAGERASGYRLRLPPPAPPASLTVAAFGPAAVRVAAEHGDRMVVNLCTPSQVAELRSDLEAACRRSATRPVPVLAAWVPAAVDPVPETMTQLRRALVSYVAAPGYGEMFAAAGFGEVVGLARGGAHPSEVLDAIPEALVEAVGITGDRATCAERLSAFEAAGVDEVVIVPATAGDPGGRRTLTALAPPARGT
jgi:probable F420-dependent oxidoreductase